MIVFKKDEIRKMIVERCEKFGSQKEYANYLGISPQYLGDIICGKRDVPLTVLGDLNIKKEIRYVRYN